MDGRSDETVDKTHRTQLTRSLRTVGGSGALLNPREAETRDKTAEVLYVAGAAWAIGTRTMYPLPSVHHHDRGDCEAAALLGVGTFPVYHRSKSEVGRAAAV